MDQLPTHTQKDPPLPSNRSFGFVFAAFFSLIGLWPLRHELSIDHIRLPWMAAAGTVLLTALAVPSLLTPFNRLWTRFGLLLHRVISPVAIMLLFYGVFTPIGFLMRLAGKDPLQYKRDPAAPSYWIVRGGPAGSLKNQF